MLRTILVTLVVLVVLVVGAVVALPFVLPTGLIVERVATQVEEHTGRSFTVDGPVDVSLWPRLTVQVSDVTIGNAPQGRAAYLARLDRLDLDMAVLPLLSGTVEIDRFELVGPDVALEQLPDGTGNWMLGGGPAGPGPGGQPERPQDIRLGTFEVVDGRISYTDLAAGTEELIEDIDVAIDLADLASPLQVDGDARYRGQEVMLDIVLTSLATVLETGTATLDVTVSAPALSLRFDGQAEELAAMVMEGALSLETDLSALSAWLGEDRIPGNLPIDQVALDSRFAGTRGGLQLSDMRLTADEIVTEGLIEISTQAAVPLVYARLEVGALDLDHFLPPEQGGPSPADGDAAAPAGWSDEPLDLAGLRAIDLDVVANTDTISLRGVELGPTQVALILTGGDLEMRWSDTAVFDGTVAGTVGLDAASSVPSLAVQATATGIRAEPVLVRFADTDRFTGTGNLNLAVRSTGTSQRQMIDNLLGEAQFLFRDGSIRGINIAGMLRDPATVLGGAGPGPQQETDFAEFGASFNIIDGIAQTEDVIMLAPLFRVSGAGDVDLPQRRVDLLLDPRLAATIEGQGGQQDVAGLDLPIAVEGPFDAIRFRPDVERLFRGMADDPEAMRQTIEQLRSSFGVERAGELESLLGSLDAAGVSGLESALGSGGLSGGASGTLTDTVGGAIGGGGDGAAPDPAIQGVLDGVLGGGQSAPDPGAGDGQTAPAPSRLLEGILGGGGGGGGESPPANPLRGLLGN